MNPQFRALMGQIEGFMAIAVVLFSKWRAWAAFAVVLLIGARGIGNPELQPASKLPGKTHDHTVIPVVVQ